MIDRGHRQTGGMEMIVAVDFDGTIFKTDYPEIKEPRRAVIKALKAMRAEGHKLILNTCRKGEYLDAALLACRCEGLTFDAVNENLPERIEQYGGDCRKISADVYIEDRAISPETIELMVGLNDMRRREEE